MLLGTFKTVFNSVFLVPTKTNTLYCKERDTQTDRGGYTQIQRRHLFKHRIRVLLVEPVHADLVWSDPPTPPSWRSSSLILWNTFPLKTLAVTGEQAALELLISVRVKATTGGPSN